MKLELPKEIEGTELEEQLISAEIKINSKVAQNNQKLTAINRINQKNGAVLNLVELITNAIIEQTPTKLPKVKTKPNKSGKTLVIGDFHFDGSTTSLNDMARFKNILENNVFEKIILGGDTLDGAIRASDRFKGVLPPDKQPMLFFDLLFQTLNGLKYNPKFFIIYGNHEEIRQFGDEYGDDTASWAEVLANLLATAGYDVVHGTRLYDPETKSYIVHGDKDPRILTNTVIDTTIKYTHGITKYITVNNKLKRVCKELKVNPKIVNNVYRFHYHFGLMENKDGINYIQFPSFYSGNRPYDTKIGKKSLGMYAIIEKGVISYGK